MRDKILRLISSPNFLKASVGYFLVQAIYYASTVRFGLPPDENYHFAYIQLFARNFPTPFLKDQTGFYVLIEAVKNPFFLYHYLLGLVYFFIQHLGGAYIILRFLNVGLGLLSLLFVYKIGQLLRVSNFVRNLTILMLAATPMFAFLAAGISYDNLFILLSLVTVYLLLKLIEKITATDILLFTTTLLAGSMVKVNYLPIGFIAALVLLASYSRKLPSLFRHFTASFRQNIRLNVIISVLLVFLGGLFFQRYVLNYSQYGTYAPTCPQVRVLSDCRKSTLFVRDQQVRAVGHKDATESPVSYLIKWSRLMEQRTFGIFAHERFNPSLLTELWVAAWAILSLIALALNWRPKDKGFTVVLVVTLFYLVALMVENHNIYQNTGILPLAIHGRYAFGVLPLLYLSSNHYIEKLLKKDDLKMFCAVISILVLLVAGLPTYAQKLSSDWTKSVTPPSINDDHF